MAPQYIIIILNIIISFTISNSKIPDPLQYVSIDQCSVYFPAIGTAFNVCNLKLPNGFGERDYYEVKDYRYSHISNEYGKYLYHFNIGAPVLKEDKSCSNITSNPGYCTNITYSGVCHTQLTPINGIAYAYQLRNNTDGNTSYIDDCWRLSNEFGGPPEWSLYYPQNPTVGVKLSYVNGDFLHDGGCPINRRFTIAFLCENEFLNVPDEEPLYETEACDYTLEIKSIYGCPVQCESYNRKLCNGEGLCGFDFTNSGPRCFCYDKFEGEDCSIPVPNENVTAPSKPMPAPSPTHIIHTFSKQEENGNVINITYDLSPMALNGMAYNITDLDPDEDRVNLTLSYRYFVGIFQSVDLTIAGLPESCSNLSARLPCTDIADNGTCASFVDMNGRDDYVGRSYAFQYTPSNDWCFFLGTSYEWELYDEIDDPARGITIDYKDGTWCGSRGINRGFRISLVCPDDAEEFRVPNINEEAYVEEDTLAFCEYSMEIETTIACPYQCRTSKFVNGSYEYSVCSEHGMCAADPNAGFVRCLCDDGWTGIECDAKDTSMPSNAPTKAPTYKPTFKPTRYPTLSVQIHNVTIIEMESTARKTGGFTVVIAILLLIVIGILIVLFIYKKFYKIGNEKEEEEIEELEEGEINEKVEMLEIEHYDSEVMEAMNKPAMMEENVDDEINYNVFVCCNGDNIEKCQIICRLLGIMISYETWNELSDGATKWNLINSLFEGYDLMDLIDDYNHYLSDHDNTESLDYVRKYILSRIHNECNKKHDIQNGRKHLMDSQHFDVSSEDIFKLEMVDKIHLYFFHKNNKKKEKGKEKIALPQTGTFAMVLGENELDNILELEQDENKNNLLELEIIKEINRTVIGHEDDNYDIDEMDVAHIDISDILDAVNNTQLQDVEIADNEDIVLPAHETNTINVGEMHPLFSM